MNDTRIYLCKTDGSILGAPTGLKSDTCNLKRNITDFWEISFEVERFINVDGNLVQSDFYDSIDDSMRLYLDSDTIQAYFIIDSEPTIKGEGYQEIKTVTAHSVESELNHIYLKNFKVNCGTYDSQEFLVTDEKGDLVNNINAYNAETMRWIKLVDYTDTRYSLMHLVLENTDWTIKDDIPEEICNIQKTYETSNSIYAFLMKSVSPTAHVIFEFDKKNKQIGIANMDTYGKDTGVFVTMRNLMNSFEITSSADDAIMTKLIPVGADNLSIEQVNFGESHIINLDYFMNTLNEYGDYKFVSKDLHDKYTEWQNFRDGEIITYDFDKNKLTAREEKDTHFEGTRRELYREITKEYNGAFMKISELTNRVPNDGCSIDYRKFTLEELKTSLTAYENALNALLTIYKNEIIEENNLPFDKDNPTDPTKSTIITINDDYSLTIVPTPTNPVSYTKLPDTLYWYDYYAYKYKIIPSVTEAFKMYCETDEQKNLVVKDGHYVELEYGNKDYFEDYLICKEVDGWLYEWSLYGLSELESKKKAWGESVSLLHKKCFIVSEKSDGTITYLTPDDAGWNSLSDTDKALFTSKDAFIEDLNKYLDYVSYDENRYNSLTKTNAKGIIRQCEDAIADRTSEIEKFATVQDMYNSERKEITNAVAMNEYFSADDILVINSILRTKDYENSNILTTNLNNVVTTVDVQEELYQEAIKKLDEISQPQYSFKTELDNLYYLEEFKAYREPFDVGNFIRVGLEIHEDLYDNDYIKLRVISISHNPLEYTEDLSIEFSTMTKSLNTISDLAFFLDEQSSISSGGSSSSSGGGTYGNNDASVQMSTTMLNALLKTETFGTAVSDVILDTMKANKGNFNSLFAHSGVFDSLEAGQIKVSGDCLFDYVKSNNYKKNESGSYLNLSDGSFEFAGGQLKYDKDNGLTIVGYASSDDVSDANDLITGLTTSLNNGATTINGGCITTGNIKSGNYNGNSSSPLSNTQGSILMLSDGKFNFAGGKLKWDGTNLSINGSGNFTGSINVNNKFIVDTNGNVTADGTLKASNANITGNINATTLTASQNGTIAGWNFNEKAFYKNNINIGNKTGFYIGEDGISIGDYFVVNDSGIYCKNKDLIKLSYSNSIGFPNIIDANGYIFGFVITNIENYIGEELKILLHGSKNTYNNNTQESISINKIISVPLTDGYKYYNASKTAIQVTIDKTIAYVIFRNDYLSSLMIPQADNIVYNIYYAEITNSNNEKTVEIMRFEQVYNDGSPDLIKQADILSRSQGLQIISESNLISSSKYDLDDNLKLYDDFSIQICETYNEDSNDIFRLNKSELFHKGLSVSSSGDNLIILSGNFYQKSSSSQRYKNSIQPIDKTAKSLSDLSPHNLYDINVVSYKYNDDYLSSTDQRYQKDITGFIAEDVYEKYPIACNLDNEGKPEMWNIDIMFPAALKLIQEQHEDIEKLKEEIEKLKNDT